MVRSSNLPSLRLFFALAIGSLAVWAVVIMMASFQLSTPVHYQETLGVNVNGELVIDSYSTAGGIYRPLPRRDLDGKKLESPYSSLVRSASLPTGKSRRSLLDGPINWSERLMWTETATRKTWYLVRNGAPEGRAYIVGYDDASRLPVQYVARDGFRPGLSDRKQHFAVGGPFGYTASQRVVGTEWVGGRYLSIDSSVDDSATPGTTLFLLDCQDVLEIDVETSSLRTIMKAPDALSIAIVLQPIEGAATEAKQTTGADGAVTLQTPMATRLAVRTRTSVTIIDPRESSQVEFNLPVDLQSVEFDVYALSTEKILIDRAERDDQGEIEHHLTWLETGNGEVERQSIAIRGNSGPDMRLESVFVAVVAPTLAVLLPAALTLMPSTLLQTRAAATLNDAYAQTVSAIWPATRGLAILSLVAAGLVLRWERKHGRPHPWRWAFTAFLLGVPGFIAYILLYGRKSLASQRRERPATPAMLGTELFA